MIKDKFLKVILIGAVAAFTLTGCQNKQEETQAAQDVVAEAVEGSTESAENAEPEAIAEDITMEMNIQDFSKAIVEGRTDISFAEMTEGYISGVMNFDTAKTEEYAVYVDATGSTVDEFGIFKAKEGCEEEVATMLIEYLGMRLDTWMDEYMPEEKPKVENAEIGNHGSYYLYVIMGENERQQTFADFDNTFAR